MEYNNPQGNIWANLKYDFPASIVVFLVALPLCLGIALASGAPLFSGLIAGIAGGIIVGTASGSQLSVSGPAAGLTVIVLSAITELQAFNIFLLAVVIAGAMQILMGFLRAGIIGHFFPSSVIKGMLAAIGLILILKQIPHAFGYDADFEGDDSFIQPDGENTFSEIFQALAHVSPGAVVISVISLGLLIAWEMPFIKKKGGLKLVPAPLLVVMLGVALNYFFSSSMPEWHLTGDHLVQLPVAKNLDEFIGIFTLPDFSQIGNPKVWTVAVTIAIVASLETLLSLDAVDKLDPYKRIAPTDRELKAQGLGNIVSGLVGGLPLTTVIVRSSANVSSGARTKVSAIIHGFLLLISAILIPTVVNLIPLSALAAILLIVGYKLTKPNLYQELYFKGVNQFAPFVITILAILFTDLLIGITIGIVAGLFFVIKTNLHEAIIITQDNQYNYSIKLAKDVSFLNKAFLRRYLKNIPPNSSVTFDSSRSIFVDNDIVETIEDFLQTAEFKNINVEIVNSKPREEETVFAKA